MVLESKWFIISSDTNYLPVEHNDEAVSIILQKNVMQIECVQAENSGLSPLNIKNVQVAANMVHLIIVVITDSYAWNAMAC